MLHMARPARPPKSAVTAPPRLGRWVLLCTAAETLGMTAAAAAAKISIVRIGEPSGGREVAAALSLVVAGGLVEGIALGALQARGLADWLPRRRRTAWVLVTVVVAGLGWAGASAPGVLSSADGGAPPPLLLVLAGAVGLGVAMGAVLGGAQALVLRGQVPHHLRWVGANALAWAFAMPVIFVGATSAQTGWSLAGVTLLGAVTGAAAGAVLGLVTGWLLPTLSGQPGHNLVVLGILGSRVHRVLGRSLVGLRVRGTRTGAAFSFPVMYAVVGTAVVVVPGHPERKRWWRNLRHGAPVHVLLDGTWQPGFGDVLQPGTEGYDEALAAYRQRWPKVADLGGPVVRIDLSQRRDGPGSQSQKSQTPVAGSAV